MHVQKRIRGGRTRWVARVRDPDGHEASKTFDRRVDAERWARQKEAGKDRGEWLDPAAEKVTVGEWLDQWLTDVVTTQVRTGSLSPSTAVGYESHVRVHLKPRLGAVPIRRLTIAQVERMLADLQTDGRSPGTAVRVRATLSKALSDAMRDELVGRNVAQLARPPKPTRQQPSVFTADEFKRITAAAATDRLGPMFVFAALTGLRASELRGLRWSDVDLETGTYEVGRGVHRIGVAAEPIVGVSGLVEAKPKTEASGAVVPLSAAAVRLLRDHRRRQASERLAAGRSWSDRGLVFPSKVGTPLEPRNMLRAWWALLVRGDVNPKTADGRGRGLHELRRTFATRLRDAGVPLEDVQRLGRWASAQVLLASYAASPADRLRAAADAAADGLGAPGGTDAGPAGR